VGHGCPNTRHEKIMASGRAETAEGRSRYRVSDVIANVCIHVYACIYVCMCVYIYESMHVLIKYLCMYACMHACMYVCNCVRINTDSDKYYI